jgi:hypothetical protein
VLYRLPEGVTIQPEGGWSELGLTLPEDRDAVFKTAELLEHIAERLRHKMARRT